ncbi:MAG: hypothetical protein Fur0012_04250 [Elusimicrobiota bacterium]
MERIFLLEREKGAVYRVLDKDRKNIGLIKVSTSPLYIRAAIIFSGFFLALLNYYIFVMMYISFRVYGLMFFSLAAGFLAFAGAFFFVFIFIRLSFAPLEVKINMGEVSSVTRKISTLRFFNLKYKFSGVHPGLFELRGLIYKRLKFANESGEILFFIRKEKGFYLLKDKDDYFGYFSYVKGGMKVDLSPDLNEVIAIEQALAAAALTRR